LPYPPFTFLAKGETNVYTSTSSGIRLYSFAAYVQAEHLTIETLDILQGTFGCPSCDHAGVDPYWDAQDWHEAARGDGGSYSGVLDVVRRRPQESGEAFSSRTCKRAAEFDAELACSRCTWL
jgi:hypothetical protein